MKAFCCGCFLVAVMLASCASVASALDTGVGRRPSMGFNTWYNDDDDGGGDCDYDYDYQKLLVTMTCAAALHAAGHQPSFQESKV